MQSLSRAARTPPVLRHAAQGSHARLAFVARPCSRFIVACRRSRWAGVSHCAIETTQKVSLSGNSLPLAGQIALVPRHSPAYLPRQVLQHGHPKPVALLTPGARLRRPVVFFFPVATTRISHRRCPPREENAPVPGAPRPVPGASSQRTTAPPRPPRRPVVPREERGSLVRA